MSVIASLPEDRFPDGQSEVAAVLAGEVDGLVRRQLVPLYEMLASDS